MLCPEVLSQLDFGICAVAARIPLRADGQPDKPARDAYQKKWIAERCDYHHTHFEAFNEMFIAYYELVATKRSNMVPEDEEEAANEDQNSMGEEHAEDEDGGASASGACMW